MNKIAAFPGKYIQGQGALKTLPKLLRMMGKKGLILALKTVKDKILPRFGAVRKLLIWQLLSSLSASVPPMNRNG